MHRAERAGQLLGTSVVERLLAAGEQAARWPENRLTVLTYHRVGTPDGDGRYPGLVSATPAEFGRHVETLGERFRVVDLDTVLAAVAGEARLPPRAVLLTFDDAVDDFRVHAWPILERAGLPTVLFVPTAFPDSADAHFWWDAAHAALTTTGRGDSLASPIGPLPVSTPEERQQAFLRLREHLKAIPYAEVAGVVSTLCDDAGVVPPPADVMSWDALRTIADAGVSCCAHTRTHPHLDQVPIDVARAEIEGSLADLRRELGSAPSAFAYPSGHHTDDVVRVVREAGISAAFTTRRGTNPIDRCDPLRLRRINVSRRTGLGAVRVQMHPWAERIQAAMGSAS